MSNPSTRELNGKIIPTNPGENSLNNKSWKERGDLGCGFETQERNNSIYSNARKRRVIQRNIQNTKF